MNGNGANQMKKRYILRVKCYQKWHWLSHGVLNARASPNKRCSNHLILIPKDPWRCWFQQLKVFKLKKKLELFRFYSLVPFTFLLVALWSTHLSTSKSQYFSSSHKREKCIFFIYIPFWLIHNAFHVEYHLETVLRNKLVKIYNLLN